MKFIYLAAIISLSVIEYTNAFAQISIEDKKPVESICPIISPLSIQDIKTYDYYDHYVLKVRQYVEYLGDVTRGEFSPIQAYTIYDLLNEQYKIYSYISEDMADLIVLVDDIRTLYSSSSNFSGLNTKVAANLAKPSVTPKLNKLFQTSTICVGPSPKFQNQFEVHFYGVKQRQCELMVRHTINYAKDVFVNGYTKSECLSDHRGDAIKKWTLWSNLGKNQVTLTFAKTGKE